MYNLLYKNTSKLEIDFGKDKEIKLENVIKALSYLFKEIHYIIMI